MRAISLIMIAGLSAGASSPPPPIAPDCWGAEDRSRSFHGTMSTSGGTIQEQIGSRGSERVIQSSYGDLRVCMVTDGFDGGRDDRPNRWPARSDRVLLETRTPGDVRSMEVSNGRVTYSVNGSVRQLDAAALEWRDNLIELLDATWDLGQVRGRVSSMRGEISSIYGTRSSLQGQISSYRGQVSSMKGEISSLRGAVSAMRGEISSLRGREGSSREVQDIERRIDAFDVEAKVAEVERRIREFDVEAKVAAIQKQIDELDVDDRVRVIESDIRSLNAAARSQGLEQRRDEALAKLRRTL